MGSDIHQHFGEVSVTELDTHAGKRVIYCLNGTLII